MPAEQAIQAVLVSQYGASLEMITEVIAKCSDALWFAGNYHNRTWHIAYHALFYTHLYLQPSEAEFRPWSKHRPDYQFLGPKPATITPYSKAEVLEFAQLCRTEMPDRVRSVDLDRPSGFPWLPVTRLEVHLYNLRHLQHHTGQLIDRARTVDSVEIAWVGTAPV